MGWWETSEVNSVWVNAGREVDDSGGRRSVEADNFILDMWNLRCPWKTGWLIQVVNDLTSQEFGKRSGLGMELWMSLIPETG